MAQLTRLTFNEAEIDRLVSAHGELGQFVIGLGDQVVNEAISNATHRPGPRIRSGELIEHVRKEVGADEHGLVVDIGSDAVSPRQDYPYPSRLETGEDGLYFPWLRPALERVIERTS